MINPIFRRSLALLMILCLSWTTVACGTSSQQQSQRSVNNRNRSEQTQTQSTLPEGQYEVQQASYDDVTGEYRVFLLNANPPILEREQIKMARLTPEEEKQGKNSYLSVENGEYSLHIDEDFRIEYFHGVAETQTDSQGQQQRVIVRRESSFWSPFAGAVAGQAIGSALFQPRYYVPPAYESGRSVMSGYGDAGTSYSQAVNEYQDRHQSPPPAEQNRRAQVRTTGSANRSSQSVNPRTRTRDSSRSTGSGVGSSTLRSNDRSGSSNRRSRSSGFGSGGSRRRSTGGRRRR